MTVVGDVAALMQAARYDDALRLLEPLTQEGSSDWNAVYLAGQCCRFQGDLQRARDYLGRAANLAPDEPSVWLALGIVHQQGQEWERAIQAFAHAIEIEPDYELAYNSLAMTQKMCGQLEEALDTYEEGANALVRRIVKQMVNDRANPILKHSEWIGQLWLHYAMYGCTYLAAQHGGITSVAWPSGEAAAEEERTERHAGLYWADTPKEDGLTRLFLPNYFNSVCVALRRSGSYANLIGNRGTVLGLLGRQQEADEHFAEATLFSD